MHKFFLCIVVLISTSFLPIEEVSLRNKIAFVGRVIVKELNSKTKKYETRGSGSCVPVKVESLPGKKYKVRLLTAYHVVRGKNTKIEVQFFAKQKRLSWDIAKDPTFTLTNVKILVFNPKMDYACLEAITKHFIISSPISLKKPRLLQRVYAAGYPLGLGLIVSQGIVSGQVSKMPHKWMLSAPVEQGNSGGPVYDIETGKVIGITTSIWSKDPFGHNLVPHMHLMVVTAAIFKVSV